MRDNKKMMISRFENGILETTTKMTAKQLTKKLGYLLKKHYY